MASLTAVKKNRFAYFLNFVGDNIDHAPLSSAVYPAPSKFIVTAAGQKVLIDGAFGANTQKSTYAYALLSNRFHPSMTLVFLLFFKPNPHILSLQ